MAQVDYFWRSDSADPGDGYNWATDNNWWRGFAQAPQGSENIIFDNNHKSGSVLVNNLGNANRFRILFNAGASSARTVTGTTENSFFDFGGNVPRIINNDTGLKTLAFPIRAGFNNFEINPNGGGITIDRLNLQNHNVNVQGHGGHTLTIRGELRGSGSMTIQSNSIVTITGIPTNTGTMTVNMGALRYQSTTGSGHTNTINVGATSGSASANLLIGGSGVTVSNRITVRSGSSGNKTIGHVASGAAIFSGAITLQASVTLSNGAGGSLAFSGPVDFNSGQRTLTVPSVQTVTVSGAISGDGGNGMVKQGAGLLRLAANNTYTGSTTIDAGTLAVVSGGNAGSGSDVYIAAGAVFTTEVSVTVGSLREKGSSDSGTAAIESGAVITVNGANKGTFYMSTISGAGGLTVSGSGTSTMRVFGANTYTGNTVINSGTLGMWGNGSIANSARVFIGTNAVWDVSTRTSGLTHSSGQGITVMASSSGSPATIHTASGTGTLSTASNSELVFSSYSSGGGAPLIISGNGSLTLASGNSVIVTNTGLALGAGSYKLISKGASSSVAGTAPGTVTVAGSGLASGASASLSITGGELFLVVISTEPDVLVFGNDAVITDESTTPSAANHTEFGDVLIAGGILTRTFTITNTGNATLNLGTITTNAGGNPTDFIVTTQPGSLSLSIGATTTFQIRFDPTGGGIRFADIQFTNNVSGAKNPYSFRIQGTGTYVEVTVSGNGVNVPDGDNSPDTADHTDFGPVGTEVSTLSRTFTITNIGNRAMSLGAVSVTGTHATNFVVTSQPNANLNPSNSTSIVVLFNPSGVGMHNAELSFSTTDDSFADGLTENPFNFSIQGTGVAPAITGFPTALAFSSVLGSVPAAQNFHVTNCALGTMVYTVASNASWISLTPGGGSVGAGAGQAHAVVPLVLNGQQVGTSNATITISSATATNSPKSVEVNWTISAIPSPTGPSAIADGREMVRLAWTRDVSYNVMVIHKQGSAPVVPTNGTVYSLGYDFGDGSRVIAYNSSASRLEHVVTPGVVHYYAVYSMNNHFYSPGAGASVTMGSYRAGEIVDPGAYTNGTAVSGFNQGQGWTGGWITGGSGTWTAQTNYSAGGGADVPGLYSPVNYPAQTANRFTVTLAANESTTARKTFAAVNSGNIYVAGLVAYRYSGNNKFVGISFMNGAAETGFVGKAGGGSVLAIDSYGGGKVNGSITLGASESSTGNVYLIIAKYNFASKQIRAHAYLWSGTVPTTEPGSWDATATVPGNGISSIDGVRMGGGGFSGDNIGSIWFDEVRIAGSWADLLGLGAVAATNYAIGNSTNYVFDGQVAAGTFPVVMALRSQDGVESISSTPPYFVPNFDILNPSGTVLVNNQVFANFAYQDSGRTLLASNSAHATVTQSDVALGVHTARWSAVSSNGVQAVDVTVLSNNTAITFTVIDDDGTPPAIQDFRIFGSSGNATLTVSELSSGSGWAITGLVQDAGSGINVNGSATAQPDISPYFELWDPAGVMRLRQAFNQIPFADGGATAGLTSIGSSNNTGIVTVPLGVWTSRVVVADADDDRLHDRLFTTNEFSFRVNVGDSTAGMGSLPNVLNVTSTYGSVSGSAPWPVLTVTNIGIGPLIYDVTISYVNGFGWLSVNPGNGNINTGGAVIHTGAVQVSSLNPGNYEAVMAFTGNQTNGTQFVTNRLTVIGYNAGEIVDQFTNSSGGVNGTAGGAGWSNAWNASAAYVFSNSSLATPNNYPASVGNRICGNTVGAEINAIRSFPAFTGGKVFMAVATRKSDGNSDGYFGISFLNGSSEVAFAGKLFNDGNFGIDLGSSGGPQSGGFGANGTSIYMFIGMYDFGSHTFYGKAYNSGDTLPLIEPTWGASKQPTVPLTRIDGVRLAAKDEGSVCFDEVRVATSWESLLNQFTTTPTLHATSLSFTNVSTNAMVVAWTPGNGLNRIVIAREGSAVTFVPSNGVDYAANNNFALANDLNGHRIIYNASGSSVPVSGLNPETRYYFAVFEYNGGGLTASYYTNAGFLTGSRWTHAIEPAEQAAALNAYTVSDSSISNTWIQAGGSPAADGYLILRSYAPVSNTPVDGVGYTTGQLIGNAQVAVVNSGTAETYLHTGLVSCSNFHFRIFAFGWNGSASETYNYVTNNAPSAEAETTCEPPVIQASDISFTLIATNRIGLTWVNGNGQSRLVVVRGTNAVNQNPIDGTSYAANPVFGGGSHLGDGNFVVFNGTGNAVQVSGLFPGATYHFRVYEYNGLGSGIDYNVTTTNGNPRSAATASFGLVEDKFDYSSGNMFGYNGGTGWTNSWGTLDGLMQVVDGNFGAFGAYPSDSSTRQGNLNSTTKRSAFRNFPARTSGRLYFAIKINLGSSLQNAYFGVNLLNGAASGGAGNNSVTGFFGKAFGVADNKFTLVHNGNLRTNKIDGSNSGYQFNSGTGNDYLMVAMYDFDAKEFKARAYISTQIAHADPNREDAWIVEMNNVSIDRIDGIEIIGEGLGNCYFDHVRIGPSWEEVMWNLPDRWHDENGPVPSLVYIGTNYNPGFYSQVVTNLSDAELKSSGNIDFAVRWDSSIGVFITNNNTSVTNIGSPNGRVNPNWDPLAIGVATNAFNLDRFFTNYFGINGANVITTYQYSAFNITNIDFEIQYFVTVSAETDPGGTTVAAPNGGNAIPVNRAVTINEPLRFYVYDDDTNTPLRGPIGMDVMLNGQSADFQDAGPVRRYFIRDGELATSGVDVSINAYDAYSGLQRAEAGSAATNMSLTITNLVSSNTSYFVSSRSTPASGSTNAATSNLWSFAGGLFNFDTVTAMWGDNSAALQGQDLPVIATVPDNDNDRVEDQASLNDERFGFIRLLDDDIAGPDMSTARVAQVSEEGWTNTPGITLQWSLAVDDLSGVDAHWIIAPSEIPGIPPSSVGGSVSSSVVNVIGQGVLTGFVFAVDGDNDRFNDRSTGNLVSVSVRIDTNPPPRVANLRATDAASDILFDPGIDESSEIKVEWSAYSSMAEAAGWRNQDEEPLSPWNSYIITYHEVQGTNKVSVAGAVTTVLDQTMAAWSNALSTHTFTNLVLSNLNFDANYLIAIQGRDAAGNIGLLTNVIGNTDRFIVTQGLARAGLGVNVRWTGPADEQVLRDYDIVYYDAPLGFRNSISNQWLWMQYTNRPEVLDVGAVDRIIPGLLTGTTYRFYRVAKQDRWQTDNNPRVGSMEIYVSKALALNPGENWHSMFSFPDPVTTNELESTLAYVFGTNLLPRGNSQLFGTKISWFGASVSGDKLGSSPTATVWLANSGWQWVTGGVGNANSKRVPLDQGFLIELPFSANPTSLVLIGRMPTQEVVHVVVGTPSASSPRFYVLSHAMPERISLVNLGITTNNGFRGGVNIGQSDEIRVLDNAPTEQGFGSASLQTPKVRIYWRNSDRTWRTSGGSLASGYVIEPDDAVIIVRRHPTTLTWTNRPVFYSPPTKNFSP